MEMRTDVTATRMVRILVLTVLLSFVLERLQYLPEKIIEYFLKIQKQMSWYINLHQLICFIYFLICP